MALDHTEKGFESAIEARLLGAGGYQMGDARPADPVKAPLGYNAALALWPGVLIGFLKASQTEAWAKIAKLHGAGAEAKVVALVVKELDLRGTLDVLRHGVTDSGVKLRLAFFRPASALNPETLAAYGQNVLTLTRQVHYTNSHSG